MVAETVGNWLVIIEVKVSSLPDCRGRDSMLSYGFQEKGLLSTPPIPRYSLNFLFLLMMWVPPPPSQLVRTTLVVL